MKGYALRHLSCIEQVHCNSIGSQSHSYFILHRLSETQESLVKLDSWVMRPLLFVHHSKIESQMRFLLDIFCTHSCLRPHQQLRKGPLFAGQKRNRWSISWPWTNSWCNRAIRHIWRLHSDLLLIEISLSAATYTNFLRIEQLDTFVIVLLHFGLLYVFVFLFGRRRIRTLFELQQLLVIFAHLLGVHDLFTLRFLLDLTQDLLSGVKKDLLKVLHIALLSTSQISYLFMGFGLNSEDYFFLLISSFLSLLGRGLRGEFSFNLGSSLAFSSMAA